jgi:hypothetical protein
MSPSSGSAAYCGTDDRFGAKIGIGGHLAVPPLPHHRHTGHVPRRFDWVKLGQRHGVEGDRASRSSGIGTTRSRVSFFMNKFRKLGFIEYNGGLSVHSSLLNVVLHD